MEATIKKIQTAIFTRNFQIQNEYDKSNILLELKEKVGDIFNGQPIWVPVPNDAPQEIPRIVLNSLDNVYSCNIALNRSDVFLNLANPVEKETDALFEKQKSNSFKIFTYLKEKGAVINRVGFVVDVEYQNEKGVEFLRERMLKENKFQEPKELSFRYNHTDRIEEIDIETNNLITISGKTGSDIIQVQFDINTVAEIIGKADFSKDYFEKIIAYSERKSKKMIDTFPEF